MIQRYSYDEGDGNWRFAGHVSDSKGDFVLYKDHKAITDQLHIDLERVRNERNAAYNRGLQVGKADALWDDALKRGEVD